MSSVLDTKERPEESFCPGGTDGIPGHSDWLIFAEIIFTGFTRFSGPEVSFLIETCGPKCLPNNGLGKLWLGEGEWFYRGNLGPWVRRPGVIGYNMLLNIGLCSVLVLFL